jgi:hypothetical protein
VVGKLDARANPVERPLGEGAEIAMKVSGKGQSVRIHSVTVWVVDERDDQGYTTSSHGCHGWVVGAFEVSLDDRTYIYDDQDEDFPVE